MTARCLLGVTLWLGVAGAALAQPEVVQPPKPATDQAEALPPPRPAAPPTVVPLLSLPQLAQENGEPPVRGAETAGLPPAMPSLSPEPVPPPGPVCWVSGDYLLWWLSESRLRVPLVLRGADVGVVGQQPDLGGVGRFDGFSGGRLRLGVWLDAERTWGAEAGGFLLGQQSKAESVGTDNAPLERVFINGATGQTVIVPVVIPDVLVGNVTASANLQFGGAGAALTAAAWSRPWCRLDVSAGYRFLDLREALGVAQESAVAAGPISFAQKDPTQDPLALLAIGFILNNNSRQLPALSVLRITDQLQTTNTFHGVEIGGRGEWDCGAFSLAVDGRFGVGAVHQEVRAAGATLLIKRDSPDMGETVSAQPGGLFVGPGNIGSFSRTRAGFVGELDVTAGAQVVSCVRVVTGYSGMFWGGVVRPGNQLESVLNPARTGAPFRQSGLWVNGLHVGLEIAY